LDHLVEAQASEIIIMCGLKPNKLDDLEDIVRRGRVRLIVVAGALAMSLRKADARLHGHDVSIGRAENDSHAPFYVPEARIEQAQRILMACQEQDVRLVLPVDFVLEDGKVADVIPPHGAQQDIGPKTVDLIDQALSSAVALHDGHAPLRLYFNGVPGRFEDPRFQSGSEQLIALVRRMTLAGVDTYVGGGEGRQALVTYAKIDDVKHAFTAGGTVLKAVSGKPLGFLSALEEQQKLVKSRIGAA
jgi:phosphoglycerate kinase